MIDFPILQLKPDLNKERDPMAGIMDLMKVSVISLISVYNNLLYIILMILFLFCLTLFWETIICNIAEYVRGW